MSKPTYEELEAKVKQLEADNKKAMSVLKEANGAVLLAKSKFEALAAENTGMKAKGRELLGEACAVYAKFNKLIDPEIGDFIDGQTLHEFQYVLDCETPATDAFLAEVRAQGVEMLTKEMHADISGDDAREFADNLRKGVQS